jgi:hypothetical protein
VIVFPHLTDSFTSLHLQYSKKYLSLLTVWQVISADMCLCGCIHFKAASLIKYLRKSGYACLKAESGKSTGESIYDLQSARSSEKEGLQGLL